MRLALAVLLEDKPLFSSSLEQQALNDEAAGKLTVSHASHPLHKETKKTLSTRLAFHNEAGLYKSEGVWVVVASGPLWSPGVGGYGMHR